MTYSITHRRLSRLPEAVFSDGYFYRAPGRSRALSYSLIADVHRAGFHLYFVYMDCLDNMCYCDSMLPDYNSVSSLHSLLENHGLAMQKKFGQNFLIHPGARRTLIQALDVSPGTTVWEAGPGLGAVSAELLDAGAGLTVFEIDRGFCAILRSIFSREIREGQCTIIEGDMLKTIPATVEQSGGLLPQRFFGNLPYNIAATLIAGTIERGFRFPRAVVTVQKEVAQRMAASPGTKEYSAFSVLCSWAYTVQKAADFPPSFFWPRPDVDSRAVILTPVPDFPRCSDTKMFVRMIHAAFSSRRKTIKNNLIVLCGSADNAQKLLDAGSVDANLRAENLSADDFLRLFENFDRLIVSGNPAGL
jgi:16S rRNA (adenine1518-N6/adenine1519-N6)-dimethyltransferase